MTRKEFAEMSFEDLKFAPISIGRSWERKRFIEKFCGFKISASSPSYIAVYGRQRHGTYTLFESFPCSFEGFEQAKKFALK
jgi:hypothetical protein